MDPNFLHSLGSGVFTFSGGMIYKLVEKFIKQYGKHQDPHLKSMHEFEKQMSDEMSSLRSELVDYREEVDKWKSEAEMWREKYWKEAEIGNRNSKQINLLEKKLDKLTPVDTPTDPNKL